MAIVVYLPVFVNGQRAGWEGRYVTGAAMGRLRALVDDLPDGEDVLKSGLLRDHPDMHRWWGESHDIVKARQEATEKKTAGIVGTLKAFGRKVLADDESAGQP